MSIATIWKSDVCHLLHQRRVYVNVKIEFLPL